MELKLLEIGSQTDQLTACTTSLLLGVYTANNQIEALMKLSCQILSAEHALIMFYDEPYLWYWHHPRYLFKACAKHPANDLVQFDTKAQVLDQNHADYDVYTQHLADLGLEAKRLIGIGLQDANQRSMGQAIFFDDQANEFDTTLVSMVQDYIDNMMQYVNLQHDYADLKEQYEQQSSLNFSKNKFFQIIAHDLRAPFHGLLGFSEVLAKERETLDEEGIQDIAEYVYDTAQSTYNLLESLLNWALSEGGRFVYHPINFDIKQSSQIVTDVLGSLAVKKDIRLIDNIAVGTKIYADINMITSVIQNLVSNALKFTSTDGTGQVILSAKQSQQYVEISIQDTGLGMSEAQIERLFEAKITVSNRGTSGEKGTGLGLILCKRFIDLNHGHISVSSSRGKGTTFKVSLPVPSHPHQTLDVQRQTDTSE